MYVKEYYPGRPSRTAGKSYPHTVNGEWDEVCSTGETVVSSSSEEECDSDDPDHLHGVKMRCDSLELHPTDHTHPRLQSVDSTYSSCSTDGNTKVLKDCCIVLQMLHLILQMQDMYIFSYDSCHPFHVVVHALFPFPLSTSSIQISPPTV